MSIFQTYLAGLAVAHVAWFYFFMSGLLLRRSAPSGPGLFSVADLVITSVAGMALSGFSLLALGFAHLLNLFGILIVFLAQGVLFWRIKGDNWLSWVFWRATLQRFIKAWTVPALFIYLLFLILGVPAVLPPTLYDSVTYHLPYAVDWANAGQIYVDQFLRFPYYANNFLLLHSALFVLKVGNFCHFLTWLCGLLTCLGVLAFFAAVDLEPRQLLPQQWRFQPQQFLIPLGVALSPVFLRYLNVGILDVPIGLFVLVPILCAYRTLSGETRQRELVVTAGFCVGMKLTLIGYLPFFLVSLLFVSAHRLPRRKIVLLSLVLVTLSLPWYVRNFIECHDPIPPLFNFYFNHPDPIFTRADSALYTVDAFTETKPLHLLLLPFRFFTDPESINFRESGVSAMILFLYGPILFLFCLPYLRKNWLSPQRVIYVSASVAYLTFPWLFASKGRHSLHWYPVFVAWVGIVISHLYARALAAWHSLWQMRITRFVTGVFCCSLLFPTPSRGCTQFYRDYYVTIASLFRPGDNLQKYLKENLIGYLASQAVIEAFASNQKNDSRVLTLPPVEQLAFYFRKAKIISVGDYFGPARYADLYKESNQGKLSAYLTRLDISAVVVRPRIEVLWWLLFYPKFQAQLEEYGFREYRCLEDNVAIFLRSDINPGRQLIPATQ
jgi:hypothetical protein